MKKGFTLIELLGVIIILSLLVILVYPRIMNTISSSTEETNAASKKLIDTQAIQYIDDNVSDYPKTPNSSYCIKVSDLVDNGYLKTPVRYNSKDTDITYSHSVNIKYDEYGNYESSIVENFSCKSQYGVGSVIYFDVANGNRCDLSDYKSENSISEYNGINPNQNQTSCLKFYVIYDTLDSDKVSLLLDHNVANDGYREYIESGGEFELVSFVQSLYTKTSMWQNVLPQGSNKSRLPKVSEILTAVKNTSYNEATSSTDFYLETKSSTPATSDWKYGWLYDRTSSDCLQYGCNNPSNAGSRDDGYMLSSTAISQAGYITSDGQFTRRVVTDPTGGLRPVVEVSKAILNP